MFAVPVRCLVSASRRGPDWRHAGDAEGNGIDHRKARSARQGANRAKGPNHLFAPKRSDPATGLIGRTGTEPNAQAQAAQYFGLWMAEGIRHTCQTNF